MEQLSIPGGSMTTHGWELKKRLGFLHLEWNIFSWTLKKRTTINAGQLGVTWTKYLLTLMWVLLDLVGG
jgi:hypothetical protein